MSFIKLIEFHLKIFIGRGTNECLTTLKISLAESDYSMCAALQQLIYGLGAGGCAGPGALGGNIPNRAVGRIVPGVIFLNSNIEPNSTC